MDNLNVYQSQAPPFSVSAPSSPFFNHPSPTLSPINETRPFLLQQHNPFFAFLSPDQKSYKPSYILSITTSFLRRPILILHNRILNILLLSLHSLPLSLLQSTFLECPPFRRYRSFRSWWTYNIWLFY